MKKIILTCLGLLLVVMFYFTVIKTDVVEASSQPVPVSAVSNPAVCATSIWHSDVFVDTEVRINGFAVGMIYLDDVVTEIAHNPGEPVNITGYQLLGFSLPEQGEVNWKLSGVKGDIYQFANVECIGAWLEANSAGVSFTTIDILMEYRYFAK